MFEFLAGMGTMLVIVVLVAILFPIVWLLYGGSLWPR